MKKKFPSADGGIKIYFFNKRFEIPMGIMKKYFFVFDGDSS